MSDIYQEITELLASGETGALATVVNCRGSAPRKPGAKMLIKPDGSIVGTVGGGLLEYQVCAKAAEVIHSGKPELLHFDLRSEAPESTGICGGSVDVFIEPVSPAESLYILGAGHVGMNVAIIGRMLGFRTTVIDPRPDQAISAPFPADPILAEDYVTALKKADLGEESYIVICTPGHAFDRECLCAALERKARYVGMIGSPRKVKAIKVRLLAEGIPKEALDRVHAPIGLDIGAETPEEIAVSIMAEIIATRRQKV